MDIDYSRTETVSSVNHRSAKPVGMRCIFEGTIISDPKVSSIRNGQSSVTNMTVRYEEYDGKTSICQVSMFGKHLGNRTADLQCGDDIQVEGCANLNTWEKNGRMQSGLLVRAKACDVRKISATKSHSTE